MTETMSYNRLHHLMSRLDRNNLHTICGYLALNIPSCANLDTDSLIGNDISTKVMSLIRHCFQRRITRKLLEYVNLTRQDILNSDYDVWLSWAADQDSTHLVPSITPTPSELSAMLPQPKTNIDNTAQHHLRDDLLDELSPELESSMNIEDWDRVIALGQQILALNSQHQQAKDALNEAYNSRGDSYYEVEHYNQAITDYSQAIRISPEDAYAYFRRGDAYDEMGRSQQAINDYSQAIRIDPNFADAYYYRGLAYLKLKQYQQAINDYSQAIRINPKFANAYCQRGDVYYKIKQYAQAIADYTQAIYIEPNNAEVYFGRGEASAALKQYRRAIPDYTKAINIKSDYAEAYNNRGNVYLHLEQRQQAIADYSQAIRIDPDFMEAYCNRANTYVLEGDDAKAIADYVKVLEMSDDDELRDAAEEGLEDLGVEYTQ